jgi:hypothetical protein
VIRLLTLCLLLAAAPVFAQERPVRRIEAGVVGGWFGGVSLGAADADLRANTSPPQPLPLFSTETALASAPALEVTAAFALNRRWTLEGGVIKARPELRSSISADAEGAPGLTVAERVDQYVFEGRLVVMLEEIRLGARTVTFAAAGAGYLRQLHEGQTVVEEGHIYHVGGGVKHWLFVRDRGLVRAVAVRLDARLYLLYGGIAFEAGPAPHGAVSAAASITF